MRKKAIDSSKDKTIDVSCIMLLFHSEAGSLSVVGIFSVHL